MISRARLFMAFNAYVLYRKHEYSVEEALLMCKRRFGLDTDMLNELGYRASHLELVNTVAKTEADFVKEITDASNETK